MYTFQRLTLPLSSHYNHQPFLIVSGAGYQCQQVSFSSTSRENSKLKKLMAGLILDKVMLRLIKLAVEV